MKKEKYAVSMVTDNGPDYSMKSMMNVLYFGRLWRDLDLDLFVQTSFAPGHSAKNMVKHAWSPMSRFLAGVTLPITLPGEDKPPCQQSRLSKELLEKEAAVFDLAIDALHGFWNGRTYDGFPITCHKVECAADPEPYTDHRTVEKFLDAGIREIEQSEGYLKLQKEMSFLSKHAVVSAGLLQFMKCTAESCGHCRDHPVHDSAASIVQFVRSCPGKHVPLPTKSILEGHYLSFLEVSTLVETGQGAKLAGLSSAPSLEFSGWPCK